MKSRHWGLCAGLLVMLGVSFLLNSNWGGTIVTAALGSVYWWLAKNS